ncbi:MAG: DUF1697 domain-containing protein [Lacisediminihabitans sp.]
MKYVALLRGINVGAAKAVAMAELASVFGGLGFTDVKTLLRSGNVVFNTDDVLSADAATAIEAAVLVATGVQSSVLVLDAAAFLAIADADPLHGTDPLHSIATDGSKSFVTFVSPMPDSVEVPDAAVLHPEVLRLGENAIYQWIPDGSLRTKVPRSFWKQFPGVVTARNWNTVVKITELLNPP